MESSETNMKRVKECNFDGETEFEGEYLNGKRYKGKGKEYNEDDEIEFEGEYLNGERNGKGKEYNYSNGKLKFEGEYLNGKRWNGTIYKHNSKKKYEIKDSKGQIKDYYLK